MSAKEKQSKAKQEATHAASCTKKTKLPSELSLLAQSKTKGDPCRQSCKKPELPLELSLRAL